MSFSKMAAGLAFSLIIAQGAIAQKTITFSPKQSSKSHKSHGHHKTSGSNSVSIGTVQILDGYLPVYFEHKLAENFSIAAGAGPTSHPYWTDLGLAVYDEGMDLTGKGIDNHYYNYSYRTVKTGLAFVLSPRFYPGGYAMDGVFISPTLEYKGYRFDAKKADETYPVNPTSSSSISSENVPLGTGVVTEKMNCYDLTAVVGGSYQLRGHINIGWTIGIGARYRSSERLDFGYAADGSGTSYHYTNTMRSYSGARVLFTAGFNIGGWF